MDVSKAQPITFDPFNNTYGVLGGEAVGRAFHDGLALKMSVRQHKIPRLNGAQATLLLGFLAVILLGSGLLALPVSAADGHAVPYMDALFTATTSVCVTGLVTVPTFSTWSGFGRAVILLLIGGLGVMAIAYDHPAPPHRPGRA